MSKTPKLVSECLAEALEVINEGIVMATTLTQHVAALEADLTTAEAKAEPDNFVNYFCFAEKVVNIAVNRDLEFMEGHDTTLAELVPYATKLTALELEYYIPDVGFPGLFAYEIAGHVAAEKFIDLMDFENVKYPKLDVFEKAMMPLIEAWVNKGLVSNPNPTGPTGEYR
jgi:hypothetical protein